MTTELLTGIIAVEVPGNAYNVHVSNDTVHYRSNGKQSKPLPPGNWSIVGIWPEISAKEAREIVEQTDVLDFQAWFRNYETGGETTRPIYSLETLLQSKKLDITKRYVILKNPQQ